MLTVTSVLHTPRLDRFAADMRPAVERHVAKTALDIQADAQARVPVRTGTLRRSIAARPVSALAWLVAVGASYGIFIELGTSRAPARPFLTPAVERHRQPFRDGIAALLRGGA